MKRIAMLLVIAMLAITSVFSDVVDSAEATVSFELKHEDIAAYKVGFTTKENLDANQTWTTDNGTNMTDVPASVTTIDLSYAVKDSVEVGANSSHYIFFKARGTKGVELELSATPLKATGKSDINYTVKVGTSDALVNTATGTPWKSGTINMDENNTKTGSYPLEFKTSALNASNVGSYTSTISLKITSV